MKLSDMKNSNQDEAFVDGINKHLNQRVEELDDDTKDALRNIRRRALSQAIDTTPNTWQWLQPVPMMAVASVVLVVSVSLRMTMQVPVHLSPVLEDIALLTAADDLELYNDLEFYQWLEAKELNG